MEKQICPFLEKEFELSMEKKLQTKKTSMLSVDTVQNFFMTKSKQHATLIIIFKLILFTLKTITRTVLSL